MSASYTKNELIAELTGKLSMPSDQAKLVVEELIACLGRAFLRSDKVTFRNFGSFDVRVRKAKIGRNPQRPEHTYQVPPKRVIRFRAGRELDDLLNKGGNSIA